MGLHKRERLLLGLAAALVVAMALGAIQSHRAKGRLAAQLAAVQTERDDSLERLRAAEQSLGDTPRELAPWQAMADAHFSKLPPLQRMDALRQQVQQVMNGGAALQGRRHLSPEAIARIREKLETVPAFTLEIGAPWKDEECAVLADELMKAFAGTVAQVRPMAEYPEMPAGLRGVAIYSRHELDTVLADAVGQLFAELSQAPVRWTNEDLPATGNGIDSAPDMKIIVGPR